jgi:PTS system mannose-specific IIA component
MIDIIVVTHSDVATHMIQAAERVLGKQSCVIGLNLSMEDSLQNLTARISDAIRTCLEQRDSPSEGILIVTDLFGSTSTNASLSQLRTFNHPIEIVTGLNMPMMVSCFSNRTRMNLEQLAIKVMSDGQRGIRSAKAALLSRMEA